ncbi:DUF3560 domain-containing protein [Nonomuraea sp. NPDC049504]|uniref:DUF3560 domain-containing protein n=1 Tax=Nonomuraea sp. NPDC049504 TaxID=3154729 RepID=UPI00341C8781
MITIKHTHEDGTLVYGTSKGDGVYDIIRKWENGNFKFFPSMARRGLPCIGLRNSRDHVADRWAINAAAKALRAAGFEVEVDIDDEPRDRAQVLADQADRLEDRRDALERKAERHAGEAAAAHERAEQIGERFAGGQPILVGHHSERGARRDQKRMHQAMRKSIDENDQAQETARRASAVGSNMRYSAKPSVTKRRIDNAINEIKRIERDLAGYTRRHLDHHGNPLFIDQHEPASGDHRERLLARRAQLENQLEYDRAQLEVAKAAGWIEWGPDNVHVGDLVEYWVRGRKRPVLKVNRKTVAVQSDYSWPDKVEFSKILSVECLHEDTEFPAAKPRSATTATPPPPSPAPAPRKVEVPTIDTEKLKAAAQTVSNVTVGRGREAFVSPPAVVDKLMEFADIQPGMTVLEPSAGTGNIAAAAVELGAVVDCVELDYNLATSLTSRVPGVNATSVRDFLEIDPAERAPFDRVVMNPPFSGGKDILHVTHALRFLKPGGRLVAVMGAGVIFHQSKAAEKFRTLIEERGGEIEALPSGSFAPATNAATVVVVIPA